jgi:hypothetical protein
MEKHGGTTNKEKTMEEYLTHVVEEIIGAKTVAEETKAQEIVNLCQAVFMKAD